MTDRSNQRKDSEIQAAEGPPDPELESLIAPQGYDPELVDDVATMETPAQQRKKTIRFFIFSLIFLAVLAWLCTPANLVVPEFSPAPYGIDQRPPPPVDKFLEAAIPLTVGEFKRVDLKKEQVFEDPYMGATIIQSLYLDEANSPVTVVIIDAHSYINARRYLENYKRLLEEHTTLVEWQERLYIEENHIQWAAPDFADRAYGLAWNNERYFIAVTSPISAAQKSLASQFPY